MSLDIPFYRTSQNETSGEFGLPTSTERAFPVNLTQVDFTSGPAKLPDPRLWTIETSGIFADRFVWDGYGVSCPVIRGNRGNAPVLIEQSILRVGCLGFRNASTPQCHCFSAIVNGRLPRNSYPSDPEHAPVGSDKLNTMSAEAQEVPRR